MNSQSARRRFLKNSSMLLAGYTIAGQVPKSIAAEINSNNKSKNQKLGKIVCATPQAAQFIAGSKFKIENNMFYTYDMDTKEHREIEIPIGVSHDTIIHPTEPHLALVIEKDGPYACLVDFNKMAVVKKISASPDHNFTGHGTYSPDGRKLYMGEYRRGRLDLGHVQIFDTQTYKLASNFETNGIQPHAFSWFPDNRHVAIAHYGLPAHHERSNLRSLVAIYDTVSGRTVNEIKSPLPNLYMCHVDVTKEGRLFILTHDSLLKRDPQALKINELKKDYARFIKERPNYFDFSLHPSPILVVDNPMKESKFKINQTQDNYKWGLSIVSNNKYKVVGGTHGVGGTITFQKLSDGSLIKEHHFEDENPRALITTQNEEYFVAMTDKGNFHYFNAETLQISHTENPKKGYYDLVVHAKCVNTSVS